eukprot:15437356-Alexandrium_andersonii.AAC.1
MLTWGRWWAELPPGAGGSPPRTGSARGCLKRAESVACALEALHALQSLRLCPSGAPRCWGSGFGFDASGA